MKPVNIHEAKTHFSKLIEKVEAGDEVVIARSGKPVAKLVPFRDEGTPRRLGTLRGKVWFAPDWDSPEVNEESWREWWEKIERGESWD
jgi:prevent-host-death family protein